MWLARRGLLPKKQINNLVIVPCLKIVSQLECNYDFSQPRQLTNSLMIPLALWNDRLQQSKYWTG